jgi:hypothetical protein
MVQQQRRRLLLQMGDDLRKKITIEKMLFGQSQGWATHIEREEERRITYRALVRET